MATAARASCSWGRHAALRLPDARPQCRNRGSHAATSRARASWAAARCSRSFPDIDDPELTGGAVFDDGQMYSPPRLVLAFVKSAVAKGAVACNYVEALDFLWEGDRVRGVRARDRLDGSEIRDTRETRAERGGPWRGIPARTRSALRALATRRILARRLLHRVGASRARSMRSQFRAGAATAIRWSDARRGTCSSSRGGISR